MKTTCIIAAIASIICFGCHHKPAIYNGTTPKEALSTFEIEPGFKIELIASEPLITDPVDMEIDENGRLYVVEMNGMPFNKSGNGKVKLLSDTNGDGVMDKSTVFADSLVLPAGIMRWKKGLLVADPPNMLYFEDKDGDGQSDVRNTLLTGFDSTDLEININNPLLGIDNWIYLSNGGRSKTDIHYTNDPNGISLPNNAEGRMVRFRPDTKELESLSGNTQFGHSFDPWGNHILVSNYNHIYQEAIAARYLNRNLDLRVSNATKPLWDHMEVFPITVNPEMQILTDIGVFTAACGISVYSGNTFPASYADSTVFVADPAQNIIHVDRLHTEGATFKATRMHSNKEFLASKDPWFRPVNTYVGPDGALYVVDFYRKYIEGPEFMAKEVVQNENLYTGNDKGRIYRISTTNADAPLWTKGLQLGNATTKELVQKLEHPNSWWRQNAQRLLVDKNDKEAVPLLEQMAQGATSAFARLHALWTLEGLNALNEKMIVTALHDSEAGIRENAIKLAELHLDSDQALSNSLLALKNDPHPKVRYQLLCTLGSLRSAAAMKTRQEILFKDINDPWVQIAALTAPSINNVSLLNAVISNFKNDVPAYSTLVERLSTTVTAKLSSQTVHQLLIKAIAETAPAPWKEAILKGIAEGIDSRQSPSIEFASERKLLIDVALQHPVFSMRQQALDILRTIGLTNENLTHASITQALNIAVDIKQNELSRASAIDFLSLYESKSNMSLLLDLINPKEPLPVQLAALRTLNEINDLSFSNRILELWPTLTPEIREAALNTFMSSSERVNLLVTALEQGKIKTSSIDWPKRVKLMAGRWRMRNGFTTGDSILKERSRKLFAGKEDAKDIIKQYKDVPQLKSNSSNGKEIFVANCAICHKVRDKLGIQLGPDLGTIRSWTPEDILTNILDPNQSIANGFDLWEVILNNGTTKQGIISTETSTAITLVNNGSLPVTIARKDIKSITALGTSAMPQDLNKKINKQEMADLLAFLRGK